mmetsp:Transcript_28964/g.68025  ORF Transcript_28964/g.68025 Transcript_28964/m.68025 type:complete len:264 (+) Transcript_28964:142-933(+)
MKFSIVSTLVSFSAVAVSSVSGQAFTAKKKRGASFQELNEQAKTGGGALGDMDAMMKQMGVNPEDLKGMMDLPELDEVMKMMAEMSPEDLAKQMQEAMDMFGGDDMMANMLGHQDEILKTLEETGAVDAEELAKFKADPEYFEQKMKESMDQMKELLGDPEMMASAAEGMKAAQNLYNNPDAINDMMADMMKELSDEDIESVRQMFITGGGDDPMMKEMLGSLKTAELEDVLSDPVKWRETVKEGLGVLGGAAAGDNKLVGEL